MASFAWNLDSLRAVAAAEQALTLKQERMEAAKVAEKRATSFESPFATVDDSCMNRPPRPDGKPIATLVSSWMLALQHGCIQPKSTSYRGCNNGSRFLYITAVTMCASLSIVTFAVPKLFDPEVVDWFGWFNFGIVAFTELLFIASRVLGRCWQFKEPRHDTAQIAECLQSLFRRTPFGQSWVAVSVTILNVVFSILFLFGFLVIHVQMLVDQNLDEELSFVQIEYRRTWTTLWTLAYAFVIFALAWSASLDPSRFGDLREVNALVVEMDAWRILLLVVCMPITGVGFAMYCSVCCA